MKDYQQSAVYRWEHTHITPGQAFTFEEIEPYVKKVWAEMGLQHPPLVHQLPKQSTKWEGKATRFKVAFPQAGATQQAILHELAHSMTTSFDAVGHQHNEYFVGMYMTLLERFMGQNPFYLAYTAKLEKVRFEKTLHPPITDQHNVLY